MFLLWLWLQIEPSLYEGLGVFLERQQRYCAMLSKDSSYAGRVYNALDFLSEDSGRSLSLNDLCWVWCNNPLLGDRLREEHYNPWRYHGLNLSALWYHGTIEFRLFNGTLNADRIVAYVELCLAILRRAKIHAARNYTVCPSYGPREGFFRLISDLHVSYPTWRALVQPFCQRLERQGLEHLIPGGVREMLSFASQIR